MRARQRRAAEAAGSASPPHCSLSRAQGEPAVLDRAGIPYLSRDTSHQGAPCEGRGEVWIRGTPVSSGYYMQPDKTAEVFREDGWFRTGDIAIWLPTGMLKIVDRLKNLIKLKGGEYVAIESMESTYAQSVYVNGKNGGMMCYADGDMDRPIAILQVQGKVLKRKGKKCLASCGANHAPLHALLWRQQE